TDPTHQRITQAVIHVGDTVRWVIDDFYHCTNSCSGQAENWASGVMTSQGTTFDHRFTHAGVFTYYCCLHGFDNGNGTASGMQGKVIVLGAIPVQPHPALVPAPAKAARSVLPCPLCHPKENHAVSGDRVRFPIVGSASRSGSPHVNLPACPESL
nr:hypothetical protein [Fimbriimonadaceae bacterium]